MRNNGLLLLMVLSAAVAGRAEEAAAPPAPIVVLEASGAEAAVTNRLRQLGIAADCLSFDDLFAEKKLFLYDAFVALPGCALGKEQFDDIQTFVSKGGLFVPFGDAGTIMDINGDRRITLPPDATVSSKSRGPFYALTGGQRIGGSHLVREFTVVGDGPIAAGFAKGERIVVDGNGLPGLCAMNPAAGTRVICGDALVMTGRGDAERTRAGNLIQARKTGKGASIWVSVALYGSPAPWADRLLKNLFSRDTLEWCRAMP